MKKSVQLGGDLRSMAKSLAPSKRQRPFWEEMIEKFIRNQISFETQRPIFWISSNSFPGGTNGGGFQTLGT